ncbi:MAG: hypothetical protein AAF514_14530 [Verrucomicrobiota bacterium]
MKFLVFAFLMFPIAILSGAGEPALEVGQPVPVIELPLTDGSGTRSVADFAGKKTVLHLFASW